MAKLIGVQFVTYNRWENGHTTPQPRHREKLAKLVNLAEQRKGV
jgi:DNA-binding XRE family transcriptional regulator